jgi:hypothetical protein
MHSPLWLFAPLRKPYSPFLTCEGKSSREAAKHAKKISPERRGVHHLLNLTPPMNPQSFMGIKNKIKKELRAAPSLEKGHGTSSFRPARKWVLIEPIPFKQRQISEGRGCISPTLLTPHNELPLCVFAPLREPYSPIPEFQRKILSP